MHFGRSRFAMLTVLSVNDQCSIRSESVADAQGVQDAALGPRAPAAGEGDQFVGEEARRQDHGCGGSTSRQ
jgi:hypothetical protein